MMAQRTVMDSKFQPMLRRPMGFTLVELLVVVAIIALLMALLMPALKNARDKARIMTCQSGLRQLAVGTFTFATDRSGYLPGWINEYWGEGFAGVDDSGYPKLHGYADFDEYFGIKEGVDYHVGVSSCRPVKPKCLYFCSEAQQRWPQYVQVNTIAYPSGYAVNNGISAMGWTGWNPADPACRTRGPIGTRVWNAFYGPAVNGQFAWRSLKLAELDRPSFTVYMQDTNLPISAGPLNWPTLWPLNRATGALSVYYLQFSTIHMGGNNLSFFDGHTTYAPWPGEGMAGVGRLVQCQIVPGLNYQTY